MTDPNSKGQQPPDQYYNINGNLDKHVFWPLSRRGKFPVRFPH